MKIIPVLDLMQGVAVHAIRGNRATYKPVHSPLCTQADPHAVVEAFLNLHPFDTIYLADLDALTGGDRQNRLIGALRAAFPGIVFWVDQGLPETGGVSRPSLVPVVGSESLDTVERLPSRDWILSLDFFDGDLRGCSEILERPEIWPERVIVMSLNRVGSFDGPDLGRLEQVRRVAPDKQLIVAGGVRHDGDLAVLARQGVPAVLVASALHSGVLGKEWFGCVAP